MSPNHARRAAGSLSLGLLGTAVLVVARPSGQLPSPSHVLAWLQSTPADAALLSASWLLGWALIAWLTAIAFLAAAAAAPGTLGGLSRGLLRLIAPAAIRRAVELALGISLAAGPIVGGVAMAAAPPAAPHNAVLAITTLDRPFGAIPSLDRSTLGNPALGTPHFPAPQLPAPPSLDRPARENAPKRPVTVHRGDSLWLIAARGLGRNASDEQIATEWPRWYAANRNVIGDDPGLIQPGQHLEPPAR